MKIIIVDSEKFGTHKIYLDDSDYELVKDIKWSVSKRKGGNTFYAVNRKFGQMHRLIMGLFEQDKIKCDHKDMNGLNNRRCNLRLATIGQNNANRSTKKKYLGIYVHNKGYRAELQSNGKTYRVWKATEDEAALAYNELAKTHHKEFARLNVIH